MSKNKVFWTTRTGEKIDIDKMSITHLRNALKMVVRMHQEQEQEQEQVEQDYSHCRAMMRMNASEEEWKELDGTYVDEYDFYD